MATIGGMQVLFFLLMSAAGQPTDLVSQLSAQDYFKTRGIELSTDKMVELASKNPVDGQTQIAQLMALRTLGADANFKKGANYAAQRKILEDIAAGSKAQDKQGFAKEYALRALAQLDGVKPPALPALGSLEEGLAWFPASATFVAGLEHRDGSGIGSPGRFAQELFKQMPPEAKKDFYKTVDSLSNVEIRRVTAAYVYEGNLKIRSFVRLTGRFNPDWVVETLKQFGLEAKDHKNQRGTSIIVLDQAFALVGDRDLLIAGFNGTGNDREALDQILAVRASRQNAAPSGATKETLARIPAKALGYLAGEIPDYLRRLISQEFRACPKSVVAHLDRAATGIDFILTGAMEDEAQARTFIQAASKLRQDAINALDKAPAFPIPGVNLDDLKSLFNSMQLEATGAEINVRMLISEEGMKTLPLFFVLRSAGGPVAPPPAPAKKGN